MSRLIDADALEDKAKLYSLGQYEEDEWAVPLEAIDEAPTIDAVEVVRCKECKYELICNHSVQHTTRDAHSVTIGSKTVEWCSYGERKESE